MKSDNDDYVRIANLVTIACIRQPVCMMLYILRHLHVFWKCRNTQAHLNSRDMATRSSAVEVCVCGGGQEEAALLLHRVAAGDMLGSEQVRLFTPLRPVKLRVLNFMNKFEH